MPDLLGVMTNNTNCNTIQIMKKEELTGPGRNGRTKKMRQDFLHETVTRVQLLANGWEVKWNFIRGKREKTREPSRGTSDNGAITAPQQLCKVFA